MTDIDLSGFTAPGFNIIGSDYYHPFTGVFNGNGHAISNFVCKQPGSGLFGAVRGTDAKIRDLVLFDPNVGRMDPAHGRNIGALVGSLSEGRVVGCSVKDGLVVGYDYVGGLVGWNWKGRIERCSFTGKVIGEVSIGGLTGDNYGINR